MKKVIIISFIISFASCNRSKNTYDASGTFESVETIISSEANGIIKDFKIEEGQDLKAGDYVGYVDSLQLYLKKKQIEAQIKTTLIQRPDISKQLASLQSQLKAAQKEKERITNLLKADAATQKQLDDITAQVDMFTKQVAAQQSSLGITTQSISQQATPLQVQIQQINDQLTKYKIINPVNGTVLAKYVEVSEMVMSGKPLYKIADLSSLILRAYLTNDQLSKIKLNQKVNVLIGAENEQTKKYEGIIVWISNKAEFTPKTIQTKDERANLVYAVKIKVSNDGDLKIGMYADVTL